MTDVKTIQFKSDKYPLFKRGTLLSGREYLEINGGGRAHRFSAVWIFGIEFIMVFSIPLFYGSIHWHVDWGWKPEIKHFGEGLL